MAYYYLLLANAITLSAFSSFLCWLKRWLLNFWFHFKNSFSVFHFLLTLKHFAKEFLVLIKWESRDDDGVTKNRILLLLLLLLLLFFAQTFKTRASNCGPVWRRVIKKRLKNRIRKVQAISSKNSHWPEPQFCKMMFTQWNPIK
jgi:hypothetical protein